MAGARPVVVGLPRGGVPVAYEVAHALGAPLDVLAVRKLGAPGNPEQGVGAIAESGEAVLDTDLVMRAGMTRERLYETIDRERLELRRRVFVYRDGRPPLDIRGRSVIVVDDGVATGLSVLAAVSALRARGARRVTIAVPVGSRESLEWLANEADDVVCHSVPAAMQAVGRWYADFSPVGDDEVIELLRTAPATTRPAH